MDVDVKYVGDDLNIQIFDEDIGDADLVGQLTCKISSFCIGESIDDWFEIQFEGNKAGSIHMKGEWHP